MEALPWTHNPERAIKKAKCVGSNSEIGSVEPSSSHQFPLIESEDKFERLRQPMYAPLGEIHTGRKDENAVDRLVALWTVFLPEQEVEQNLFTVYPIDQLAKVGGS